MSNTSPLPSGGAIVKTTKTYARDLVERIIFSFLGGAAGVFLLASTTDMLNASFWSSVASGGVIAVIALLKGLAARGVGRTNSASLDPRV